MEELKKAYDLVKANLEAGVVSINGLVVKIDAKFKEIESNESEVANLTGEVSKLKKLLEQTEKQRDEMRQGLINAQNDLMDGSRRAATQREELEAKLKLDMQQVIDQNTALKKRVTEVLAQNDELERQNQEVRALYEECKDHPAVVAAKLAKVEEQREKMRQEFSRLMKESDDKAKELKAKLPAEPAQELMIDDPPK